MQNPRFFRTIRCTAARHTLLFGATVLLLIACFSVSRQAQAQNSGTVAGRITDSAGGIVPSATITLKSQEQGRVVTVHSNGQGEYVFNDVPVATYTLTVRAPTFADYSVNQLSVSAGENVNVNAVLQPGSASATVEVIAEGTTVDTRSATVATVIDNTLVETLPLDGNNAVETAALLPGVTDVNAPTTFTSDTGGPTYNISGSRSNQNLFLLDGALWNNLYNNSGLNYPPRESLQEVSVILNNYKAQYGRNVGSVFNVLTKSGSNIIHGTLYEFAQNKAFNARDYLSGKNPPLVQNQFGATLGGPILRDKLFFFIAYQDLRSAAVVTAQAQTPTYNERGMDLTGAPRPCTAAALAGGICASFAEDYAPGVTPSLRNPVRSSTSTFTNMSSVATALFNTTYQVSGGTGISPCVTKLLKLPTTLPNAEVPSECFNPVSLNLLPRLPVATTYISNSTTSSTLPWVVTEGSQPRNDQNGMLRIDWNAGQHRVGARYYQTAVNDRTANGVSNGTGVANYEINSNMAAVHYGNLDDTWVLASNLLNVARAAYKRYDYNIYPTDPTTLNSLGASINQPGHNTLPRVEINSRVTVGTSNQNYSTSVNEDVEFDDSLTWTKGKHNYQFGAEYLRLQYAHVFDQAPSLNFSNNYSGIAAADYMMGLVATSAFGNSTNQSAIQHDLYMYAQDDWRIRSRMTFNLGIRWEIPFQWYQPAGQAATFVPGYQSQTFPTAPPNIAFVGDPGVERSLVGTNYHNIAPRLGFAYDVFGNGRTSVRGGFGIFYDAINALVVGVSEPWHYQASYTDNPGGVSAPLLGLTQIPPNYVKGQPPQFVTPYSITFPDANFTTPYTEAINFGVQQHMTHSSVLEVNYVGRMGRHLALGYSLNPAIYDCSGAYFQASPATYCTGAAASNDSYAARVKYPNFNQGSVLDYMTVGSSSYNALQAIYHFRSGKSLTMIASYTFSKSIDISSNGTSISNSTDQPSLSVHRAVSDTDSRHIFNLGWTYRLPMLNGTVRPLRAVVNGWSFSGIYTARSGHPFSVTAGGDATLRDENPEYLSIAPGTNALLPSNRHRRDKVAAWFNNSAGILSMPSEPKIAGTAPVYGNVPRNYFVGPAFINTNFAVRRRFNIPPGRGRTLDFRVDAFNVFNTPNLGTPGHSLSGAAGKNSNFGVISATVGSNGAVGTNGRRLQISGTIRF